MLISLLSISKFFKRRDIRGRHHLAHTHDSMQQEHENRKREELHRRLAHEKRFPTKHTFFG